MELVRISNRSEKITANFNVLEFWRKSKPQVEYDFPKCFFGAGQILHDYYHCTVDVTCAKSDTYNFGYHRLGRATDYLPTERRTEILADFKNECLNWINGKGSKLIESLRSIGINGFGIEGNCIHLDNRESNTSRVDKYGKYIVFEFKFAPDGKTFLINKSL